MDGLEDKIQKILSDPEALGSVMEMAKTLTGGSGHKDEPQAEKTAGNLLSALGSGGSGGGLMDMISGLDPKTLSMIMGLVGEFSRTDDRRTQLLTALKPYVRSERQAKMDNAAQIVRLAKTAHKALGSFGGKRNV